MKCITKYLLIGILYVFTYMCVLSSLNIWNTIKKGCVVTMHKVKEVSEQLLV